MNNHTEGDTYELGRYSMVWGTPDDSYAIMATLGREMAQEIQSGGDDPAFIIIGCHAPQMEDLVARVRDAIDMPEALAIERINAERE